MKDEKVWLGVSGYLLDAIWLQPSPGWWEGWGLETAPGAGAGGGRQKESRSRTL